MPFLPCSKLLSPRPWIITPLPNSSLRCNSNSNCKRRVSQTFNPTHCHCRLTIPFRRNRWETFSKRPKARRIRTNTWIFFSTCDQRGRQNKCTLATYFTSIAPSSCEYHLDWGCGGNAAVFVHKEEVSQMALLVHRLFPPQKPKAW